MSNTPIPTLVKLDTDHPGACCVCGESPDDLFPFTVEIDGHTYALRACPYECTFDLGILVGPYFSGRHGRRI
jgi:hypothetical protein